jgi:hypothetical protein
VAVTASLPPEVQQVFDSFATTAYTTVDRRGQPVCWPATPSYEPGAPCIDVRTAPGDRDDAADARDNPKVALLFAEPEGSRIDELGGSVEAVLSLVAPDGFPFSVRVPMSVDGSAQRLRIAAGVLGVPVQAGLACVTARDRFQLRGDLLEEEGGWVVVPHQMLGPPEKSRDAG